jgi:exopolysaccharide/PEP-CTERM locus tyrosine autokinase
MTRIEDALHKLQARSQRAVATPAPPPKLAAVVPKEHAYAGARIVVDPAQLRASGLLAPDTDERRLAEQYRTIKRPLLRNANPQQDPPVAHGNLVAVVSALPGEGKTFTCLNLCLSIARERDWSVVLVDGDCSKPHLTRLFGAENEPGLIDLLRDPSRTFESLVMPTDVPGLSLLPAGTSDPHASELLASRRMDEICERLSSDGGSRMVVFDSSPLLLTTEAAVLASKVGQIVMVVRANATLQHDVVAAIERLDPDKAIGCVLNQSWGSSEQGYGYGNYGYGDSAPETEARSVTGQTQP